MVAFMILPMTDDDLRTPKMSRFPWTHWFHSRRDSR
jgi:hypothetical protein